MDEIKDSNHYFDRAVECRRWARVIYDMREIAALEELADEYEQTAQRLLSAERAPFRRTRDVQRPSAPAPAPRKSVA